MGFRADVKSAVAGAFCAAFNGYDKIQRWGAGVVLGPRADNLYPDSAPAQLANFGRGLFCDVAPLEPPAAQPFSGGQCPVIYRVELRRNTEGFPQSAVETINIEGPFREVVGEYFPEGNTFARLHALFDGNDTFRIGSPNEKIDAPTTFVYESIVRLDGLPDDCGNTGGPPSGPLTEQDRTAPITINNNNGNILFGFPILNVSGDLIAPFGVKVGEIEFTGELVLNKGDINLNFGAQPTSDPDPQIEPRADSQPPPAVDDDPDPDKLANVIGVVVVSNQTLNTTATEIGVDDGPNILVPRCATVAFKVRIGNKAHWTTDIAVKSRNTFIPCPGVIPAIDAYIQNEQGWLSTMVLVRGVVPANDVVLA